MTFVALNRCSSFIGLMSTLKFVDDDKDDDIDKVADEDIVVFRLYTPIYVSLVFIR